MKESLAVRESADYSETLAEILVETVQKATGDAMRQIGGHEDVTPALMQCLEYLFLHGPSPVSRVADGLEVSLSAASQLVDRLVKKSAATRAEDQEDRRQTRVELTPAGRKLVKQMRVHRSKWFASVLDEMSDKDRRAFLDGLEGFLTIALATANNPERACVRCGIQHAPFCVVNEVKNRRNNGNEPGL